VKKLYWLALAGAVVLCAGTAQAGPSFPPIGADTGPGIIITINPNGTATVTSTGQGPYDGIEDTYVGVINNAGGVVTKLTLTGPNIFGFDGDGIITQSPGVPGNPHDSTGYGGPNAFYSVFSGSGPGDVIFDNGFTAGNAPFTGGIPGNGGWAFFSLEERIGAGDVTVGTITFAAPEPATLALVGFGAAALAGWGWRKRKQAAA
jgi:hypothetical protein